MISRLSIDVFGEAALPAFTVPLLFNVSTAAKKSLMPATFQMLLLVSVSAPLVRLTRPVRVPAFVIAKAPVVTGEKIARSLASFALERMIAPALFVMVVVVPAPAVALDTTGFAAVPA